MMSAYFTKIFDKKNSSPIIIRDENRDPNLLVYKIDISVPNFFWVIDGVNEDADLMCREQFGIGVPILK